MTTTEKTPSHHQRQNNSPTKIVRPIRGGSIEYSKIISMQRVANSFIGESKYTRAEPNLIAKLMSEGMGVAETPELQQ